MTIHEVAPDVFRLSLYMPNLNLQFNHFLATPDLPHGWDAGVLFEETQRTLFCSDLFHHDGDVEAVTESDILGRVRQTLIRYQAGPLMDYQPFTTRTEGLLAQLAAFQPHTLATMHGSTFVGDGARALRDLGAVMREVLSGETEPASTSGCAGGKQETESDSASTPPARLPAPRLQPPPS